MAHPILLQRKYTRIISKFAEEKGKSLREALDIFYHSNVYKQMSEGIADMHCMSDGYLVDELWYNYKGIDYYSEENYKRIAKQIEENGGEEE